MVIRIHPSDSVAVALKAIEKGRRIDVAGITVLAEEFIQCAHKISIKAIKKGDTVIKYGYPIGTALCDIEPGQWVHTHNLATGLEGTLSYDYHPEGNGMALPSDHSQASLYFQGYKRQNGLTGVRNEIWILPTVACVNATARAIVQKAAGQLQTAGIDGIHALTHPYGCSQLGGDLLRTQRILAELVNHPNAGGVLVLSLGCENNNAEEFKKVLDGWDTDRVRFLTTQDSEDEVEEGIGLVGRLVEFAASFRREPVPVSELRIGMKCGASDAFSGITANPLAGKISDILSASGGTSVLTEVPEMFGAERLLMNRAKDRKIFDRTVEMINRFKEYFLRHGQPIYENPAPGNKAGGISTLEEKSLGCILKGGTGTVNDVLEYGDKIRTRGLNLLEGPGNDLVSATALAASGCQLLLFTTGRGNPLGTCIPTIKISSNSELAVKKKSWIDFDAGQLLNGQTLDSLSGELFRYILKVASGDVLAGNEVNGFHEIGIFKDGVTL